jgi:hypothetical protein
MAQSTARSFLLVGEKNKKIRKVRFISRMSQKTHVLKA